MEAPVAVPEPLAEDDEPLLDELDEDEDDEDGDEDGDGDEPLVEDANF